MTLPLPRLAALTIERERVSAWLNRYADVPLRLLLAPAGSGKTTALVNYARKHAEHVLYVHMKYRAEGRSLEDDLCEIADLQNFHYAGLLAMLAAREHVELIIDGIEHITASESALLERLVYDIPAHIALIYAGTRSTIPIHRLEAAGLAQAFPQEQLLFTADDTQALCIALAIQARHEDVVALNECCSGWPAAVADVLRCAVEEETALVDAYDRWVEQRGRTFTAYVQEEITRLPAEIRTLFGKVVNRDVIRQDEFTMLKKAGAFVYVSDSGVRVYNVVSDLIDRPIAVYATREMRLSMRMFGRFSFRCGDREVTWIRRRDQQVFRFIALRPSGRVMKSELLEMFWPDSDPHLAAQSLRTACSNIRKALASVTDAAIMERLFVTEGQEIYVNLSQVVVDVRRFKAHVNEGNEAEDAGRPSDAIAHYHAANRLYRADLFSGDPEEAWFVPQRAMYHDMAMLVRERIKALRAEDESLIDGANEFIQKALDDIEKSPQHYRDSLL